MKIGLLNPTVLLRRPIVELAHKLEERGHKVTIITPVDQHSTWTPAHFENEQINTLYLPSKEIRFLLWTIPYPATFRRLWKAMKNFDVIQIWAPYYIPAILPLIYRLFLRQSARIILTFDTFPGYSFQFDSVVDFLMRFYHQTIGRLLFNRADAITLYGQQLLKFLKIVHINIAKIQVISTGVSMPQILAPRLREKRINLLFIGLMNRRKGVDVLLKALTNLKKDNVDFHANLVGDGPQRKKFITESIKFGVSKDIDFIGRTSKIKEYFSIADMLILPSYGEGLPGVVMEAMAFGVPVIASNIPCLPDLIPNKSFGQLFPVGDVDALVRAILTYVNNIRYYQSVVENARKHIQSFNWEKVVPKYEALYESLA